MNVLDPVDRGHATRVADLMRRRQDGEAVEAAYAWWRTRPSVLEASQAFVLALLQNGQPREAIVAADAAVMLFPKRAEPHLLRGLVFDGQDDARAMFRAYRQAALLDRRSAEARKGMGDALFRLDRPERAERCLQRAVRLAPSDATFRSALAVCLASLHRYADALGQWHHAVRLDETYFWTPRDERREAELWLMTHCRERLSHVERQVPTP